VVHVSAPRTVCSPSAEQAEATRSERSNPDAAAAVRCDSSGGIRRIARLVVLNAAQQLTRMVLDLPEAAVVLMHNDIAPLRYVIRFIGHSRSRTNAHRLN
jgi:hypothetical protein